MYKDIVVRLDMGNGNQAVVDYAVSAAKVLGAHITGIAIALIPNIPGASMGYLPIEKIEATRQANEAAAEAAVEYFIKATASAGVSSEAQILRADFSKAAQRFSRVARRFDIAIVAQAEPNVKAIQATIAEATLFESGRPMIVVPYIQKAQLKLDRVMVCWDGSRTAVRAIADAIPLLEKTKDIEVVKIVTSERHKGEEFDGADMGLHLARHGFKVQVTRIQQDSVDAANALLSHCADSGADFMIMGGYGHSRLREFVLGGVTRSILSSMTVPTLMSH